MPILHRNRGQTADAERYGFVPGEEADVARPGGGGGRGGQQDLRTLLAMFWRRKALIIGVTAIGATLSVLMVNRMTPVYEAEARLVLEAGRNSVTAGAIENVVQGLNPDFFTHETEAEIIMSRSLATKAVDKLNLVEDPLFNPDLRPPSRSLIGSFKDLIPDEWLSILKSDDEEVEEVVAEEDYLTPAEYDAMILDWVTEDFMSGLYVDTALRSNVLFVSYSSTDPEMAAKAANAVADVFILDQLNAKYEATEWANAWLSDRVNELRQRLENSAQELENYRRQAGLLEIDGSTIFTQQYAKLSTEATAARTRRAEAEARYNQVQQLLGSDSGIELAAAVLDSPLIQRLREQEAEVLRKLGELKTQLREGHPQMVLARTELEDLQEKINS